MDALIIFGDDNDHPLRFLLNKKHRHVWCAVRLDQYWVSYNWHQGNPIINVDQAADFDLASFYREQGFEVIETTVGDEPCHGPWMCNNCVGHTMVICGIRAHHIYTPHQLWKHLTGRTMFDNIRNFFNRCEFIPGFGGGKTVFVPAPPTPTTTAPPSQTTIDADAKLAADERARLKAQKTAAGAATDLSSTLLSDEDSGTGGVLT
jgi:hypothetical protein